MVVCAPSAPHTRLCHALPVRAIFVPPAISPLHPCHNPAASLLRPCPAHPPSKPRPRVPALYAPSAPLSHPVPSPPCPALSRPVPALAPATPFQAPTHSKATHTQYSRPMSDKLIVATSSAPTGGSIVVRSLCLRCPLPAVCVTMASTTTPSASCVKRRRKSRFPSEARTTSRALGIRRAKQRWSAVVSAPTLRLASYMRPVGARGLEGFGRARELELQGLVHTSVCTAGVAWCWKIDGTPCPHAFQVAFACADAGTKLAHLHLDHEQPLHQTCRQWTERAARAAP